MLRTTVGLCVLRYAYIPCREHHSSALVSATPTGRGRGRRGAAPTPRVVEGGPLRQGCSEHMGVGHVATLGWDCRPLMEAGLIKNYERCDCKPAPGQETSCR